MFDANGRVAFRNQERHSSDLDGNLETTFGAIARSAVRSPCLPCDNYHSGVLHRLGHTDRAVPGPSEFRSKTDDLQSPWFFKCQSC